MSDENGATVEWGSPAAERVNGRRWWPRLPVRDSAVDRRGRRTISPVAGSLKVVTYWVRLPSSSATVRCLDQPGNNSAEDLPP